MKINFTRKFVPAAQTLQILRKAWLIKMRILSDALGYVMYFCYYLVHNYGLAIILFTSDQQDRTFTGIRMGTEEFH